MKPLLRNTTAGFTLLEIMLVIIIIVTLMAVLIPNISQKAEQAKIEQAGIYITRLAGDVATYEMQNSSPPSSSQGLKALVEKPAGDPAPRRWRNYEDKIQPDPWGQEYHYEFPGRHNTKSCAIFSNGPDRTPNTADDIGNWQQ